MQSSRGGEESQTGGAGLTQFLILMKAIIPATSEDGSAHQDPSHVHVHIKFP